MFMVRMTAVRITENVIDYYFVSFWRS